MPEELKFIPILLVSIVVTVTHCVVFICGQLIEEKRDNDYLVKRGLAEYYLDENNEKQWRLLIDKEMK